MRDIELEEGESYFLQDDDDDENIDPDRDFSYIDKKIENVLGQYQKDFMGGVSAETLGARFGGYGSFLPMQQRSPPILSNPATQSHTCSKSPQNPSLERSHQNSNSATNISLPARCGLSSNDHNLQASSEPGVNSMNKKFKPQSSGESSFNDQQKKPVIRHADQSSLKFRVKMTSENEPPRDISAIYSGLGLDMSPSSSPDDSPAEYDKSSPGTQEEKEESPSFIVKIMTSYPIFSDALLSPLDAKLISFMERENNLESDLPGFTQDHPVNTIHGRTYSEAKRETSKERKSKLDNTSMYKKSMQKEFSKDGKSKQKVHSMKDREYVKQNKEYPANTAAGSANRREAGEISVPKAIISKTSVNSADAHGEVTEFAALTGYSNVCKPSNIFGEKNETEPLEKDSNSLKQDKGAKARGVSEGEFVSVPFHDVGLGGEGNLNTSRGKIEKDRKLNSNPRKDSSGRRNEAGLREEEVNKVLKPLSLAKEKVKEEVLSSLSSKEDGVNFTKEKLTKEMENFVSVKDFEENYKQFGISQGRKARNMETIEPSKQKSHSRAMSNSQTGEMLPIRKEHLEAVAKKKSKESYADDVFAAEPMRENVMSGYSTADKEALFRNNVPSQFKKSDMDLHNQNRKDIDPDGNSYLGRKGKEVNAKESVLGVSEKEMHASNRKMKEKSSTKKTGLGSNIGSNMEVDLSGETTMEKTPAFSVLAAENALSIVMDDWVMCEKCGKWRLLPFGRNPDLLPKKWICKMLDWLPGMNKCTITEEETTNALYAMYQLQVPASLTQNHQQAYPDGIAPVGASSGVQPSAFPIRAANIGTMPDGGNKKTLVKTETNVARKNGFQELDIPVKWDQLLDESTNSKHVQKHSRESNIAPKSGDGKLKTAKKRVSDFQASGVSKKMKRQSTESPDPVGILTVEAKGDGQNYNPGASQISEDFINGIPESLLVQAEERSQNALIARVNEKKDVSGKKRRLNDQQKNIFPTEELSAKGSGRKKNDPEYRKYKKVKKSKSSNFQASEGTTDQGKVRAHSDIGKLNSNAGSKIPVEKHHAGRVSQRFVEQSSDKTLDLMIDNGTTSSSSKIPRKVKTKAHEMKCCPVGSSSSSPMKVSKSDPDKRVNKQSISYDEPEELSSAKRLKSRAEGAPIDFAPHNEETRDRKSSLPKTSGMVFETADDDRSAKKISSGRLSGTQRVDTLQKLENHASGRLNISYKEGASPSVQKAVSENQDSRSLNALYIADTNSQRGKSHVSNTSIKKELPSNSQSTAKSEGGSGPNSMRVDKVSSRFHQPTRDVSRDTAASSSMADSFCKAAKTALKEATDLKHSANRLKKSGSGLESTVVFFQAALKFLHGASLLEPDYSESGRSGEMLPSDVYSTTAKLCEYCAREYERFNDLASAALAYKCMEVAYMRVVYCNDLAASRYRLELQMAVRTTAQAESPSSSASDIDNFNNQAVVDTVKDGNTVMEHRNHVISAGNRPNFIQLLDFTRDINLAMEASRKSQTAFAAANPLLTHAGNEEGISCIKRVIDFSFHDVDGLLHLVRLAMETLNN